MTKKFRSSSPRLPNAPAASYRFRWSICTKSTPAEARRPPLPLANCAKPKSFRAPRVLAAARRHAPPWGSVEFVSEPQWDLRGANARKPESLSRVPQPSHDKTRALAARVPPSFARTQPTQRRQRLAAFAPNWVLAGTSPAAAHTALPRAIPPSAPRSSSIPPSTAAFRRLACHPESEPRVPTSGAFGSPALAPAPCRALSAISQRTQSATARTPSACASGPGLRHRKPSPAPAPAGSPPTTPRDERTASPSAPSVPGSSSHPSAQGAPVHDGRSFPSLRSTTPKTALRETRSPGETAPPRPAPPVRSKCTSSLAAATLAASLQSPDPGSPDRTARIGAATRAPSRFPPPIATAESWPRSTMLQTHKFPTAMAVQIRHGPRPPRPRARAAAVFQRTAGMPQSRSATKTKPQTACPNSPASPLAAAATLSSPAQRPRRSNSAAAPRKSGLAPRSRPWSWFPPVGVGVHVALLQHVAQFL